MADISELLNSTDPDTLRKLLALRDQLGGQDAYNAVNSSSLPTEATTNPATASDYSQLFAKQHAQDLVDAQSIPGKSAADSASVLVPNPPGTAEQAEANMADAAKSGAGDVASESAPAAEELATAGAADTGASILGKALGPAAALAGLYGGQTAPSSLDEIDPKNPPPTIKDQSDWTGSAGIEPHDIITSENAGLPTDVESDEEAAPTPVKSGPGPASAGAPADTGPKDYLGDMLSKLYGPGNDAKALAQAQQNRNIMQFANNTAMSQQMIAAAMSRGGFKPDYAVNAEIAQQANNPVNNILQQRQAQEGQIATAVKLSDFNDKAQQQDPNSPLSKAMRDTVRAYFPKMAAQPNFENQDYESIIKQQPFLDTVQKTVSNNLYRQALLQNNQNKQEATAEFNVPSKIDNYINNRGATKNASDADRRVDNINSLLARYPNLDNMPQGQIEEFGQELHQITAGLGAHEGSTAQLMSPTLRSRLALMESKGMNNVTGAEMGAFLKENVPYLQDLQQNARAYIGDHISGQVEGAKKLIQDPVAYSKLQDYYSKYLNASQARKQTQQAVSQVAPTPKGAPGSTPFDAAAIDWAKANINNPDSKIKAKALAFIKVNGS